MKKVFKKNKIFFISLSFLILFGFFVFYNHEIPVEAGTYDSSADTGHNLSGFAWSENIGWISFNSESDGSGNNYGVYVDNDSGDVSGFAWSENIGWISFNRNTSYCAGGDNIGRACVDSSDCPGSSCGGSSDGITGNPPEAPYNTGSGAIAKYDINTYEFDGWAKILSMGDDGWISLKGNNYGIKFDGDKKELTGWAWNGNDDGTGIGWISFNCSNDSSCASSDYKIFAEINRKPTIDNLVAPQWNYAQVCDKNDALRANLSWDVHDDDAGFRVSAYQLILRNTFGGIEFDTGKCDCNSGDSGCDTKCTIDLNTPFEDDDTMTYTIYSLNLKYNTSYKWEVRIWDDLNAVSDLRIFNTAEGDMDTSNDGNNYTFTTYKHEFPQPYFTWFPEQPSIGEKTLFISRDLSKYGNSGNDCTDSACDYKWEADPSDNIEISNSLASSTIITFKNKLSSKIELELSDSDYFCSTSTTFNIEQKLPMWIEAR